ncbi:MAG TPA: tRNA epoxyqueuosine(34) reductase QueG [Pyrinomonadaceae bacterium]|nr:tRNA epoxyqueuosine(34) reductase QueG [Pyrinomonadaceae bacterium]
MTVTSADIKAKAREIGFTSCGIVPADGLADERRHLDEWLRRGYHGNMSWMEREPEKRGDPRILLPGCRSVVVCTLNYYTPYEHLDSPNRGKISRYAWGEDYHDVLRSKLTDLLAWISSRQDRLVSKICVDTAPFMDKAWAARAGLGWIGKHTNLITKNVGSWVFIGSLLLDIALDYDMPEPEDHCGTCTACLDACPTNAIVEPYVVDSRKCISYATIELRNENLPDDIAANLNGWIYGCDICQDVCPWNRFQQPTGEPRFEPRNGETSLDIGGIAQLEHPEYVERFRGSAIKRTKLSGLKRNAKTLESS